MQLPMKCDKDEVLNSIQSQFNREESPEKGIRVRSTFLSNYGDSSTLPHRANHRINNTDRKDHDMLTGIYLWTKPLQHFTSYSWTSQCAAGAKGPGKEGYQNWLPKLVTFCHDRYLHISPFPPKKNDDDTD